MADDIQLISGAGSGTYIATNQIWDAGLALSAHWQRVKLADASEGSTAGVSASWANGLLVDVSRVQGGVSAQLSAGGAVSAFTAGQAISAFLAGQAASAFLVPLATSGIVPVSGSVSAFTAGQAISAYTAGQAISAFTAGQAISAFTAGQILSSYLVPLATSGILPISSFVALSADPFHILSANIYNQPTVSTQLSAGGAVSAFTAGQAISAFTAGQAISAFTAGQILSAWVLPLATQTPFMVSGALSAFTAGQAISAFTTGQILSAWHVNIGTQVPTVISAVNTLPVSATGAALSAQFPGQLGGQTTSSVPFTDLAATSSIIAASSGFRTFVYAWSVVQNQLVLSASRVNVWWKWQASGAALADVTGFQYAGQLSAGWLHNTGLPNNVMVGPPGYLAIAPANSAVIFTVSAVSAGFFNFGGFISYWRGA